MNTTNVVDVKGWAAEQQELIDKEYERIQALLVWSSLYGYPIDSEDPKHLVVGAWCLATQNADDRHLRELERRDLQDLGRIWANRPRGPFQRFLRAFKKRITPYT